MKQDFHSEKCWIDRCFVSKISKEQLLTLVRDWIIGKEKGKYITAINVSKLVIMQKDEKVADCILGSSVNIADGFPIFLATKFLGNPVPERITGVELMEELLRLADENRFSVYFLGSKPEILREVLKKCMAQYPNIEIAGSHHGYYLKDEENGVVDGIAWRSPDLLLVALGLPQKEYFVADYAKRLNASVILPVGGGFDVFAGLKRRAPKWVQNLGIEWLWRSVYDRSRGKLIWGNFIPFFIIIIKEIIKHRVVKGEKT